MTLSWRKSSASSSADDCVEVAASGRSVLVRDSHDRSAGVLALAPGQWHALVNAIQNGNLDGR
ncbi:DUF397 domain-containing protein [Actinomadura darangshiensis]|uniref:DUF397 domain-containing protein n=1 Tax=Actinomadura darangshiensis TaxID=705336 RepID=UPI001FB68CBB|nr:DUF397 domain-containing protein [Actinomadura darangshiensis]